MDLTAVRVEKPDDLDVIIGQAHFIKTVEDPDEALAGSSPQLRFGVASARRPAVSDPPFGQ